MKLKAQTEHNYTARYWGHDYSLTPRNGGRQIALTIWGGPFHEGEYLILPNGASTTRYQITNVDWFGSDPGDMYELEAEFAPRHERGKGES